MIELSELYKINHFNIWIKDNYRDNIHKDHQIFKVVIGEPYSINYELENMEDISKKIIKLECKLSAEQMVVAFTKAEKEAKVLIDEEKTKTGWSNWISSSISSSVMSLSGIIGYG